MKNPFILLLLLSVVTCQYRNGDGMTSARACKETCIDKGGVFCRNFGELASGYCCDSATTSPCNLRMQQCTIFQDDVQKYYSCPFNETVCGPQTIDVGDDPVNFTVSSNSFRNFTFCTYQFRQLALSNKVINVKVDFANKNTLAFMAVTGEAITKGHDAKNLTSGQVITAQKYERVFLQAKSINSQPDTFTVTYYLTLFVEPETPVSPNSTLPTDGTTTNPISTNTTQEEPIDTGNYTYSYEDPTTSSSGGGTAIVVVIAVLVVLIPVGFLVSCIIKKVRERKNAELNKDIDAQQLPDQSQISQPSPDHFHTNLYPFPMGDNSENMQNFMQGIQKLGPGGVPE